MPSRAGDSEDDDDDLAGETEDLASPLISDVEEDAFSGSGSDGDTPMAFEGKQRHGDNPENDDESSSSDAEVDLIEYDATDSVAEEWTGLEGGVDDSNNKRKRSSMGGNDGAPARRKKKSRSLPTFASYEDYADMIEDGPEDNL